LSNAWHRRSKYRNFYILSSQKMNSMLELVDVIMKAIEKKVYKEFFCLSKFTTIDFTNPSISNFW